MNPRRVPLNDISASGANKVPVHGKRRFDEGEDEDEDLRCGSGTLHHGNPWLLQSPEASRAKWNPSKRVKEDESDAESLNESEVFDEAEAFSKSRSKPRSRCAKSITRSTVRAPLGLLLRRELAFPARPSARTVLEYLHGEL